MNLKTKKTVITAVIGLLSLMVFFAGIIAGISLQQKYDYDKAYLDSLIRQNRTCYDPEGFGGYCKELSALECEQYSQNMVKIRKIYDSGV